MTHITVRSAIVDDAKKIAEIQIAAWRAAYSEIMDADFLANLNVSDREAMWKNVLTNQEKGIYLVGLQNREVQGFCAFGNSRDETYDESTGELIAINVHPQCWRAGIGAHLIRTLLNRAYRAGFKRIYLWVVKGNDCAIGLYTRFGFSWSGETKIDTSHSNSPITELLYERKLG